MLGKQDNYKNKALVCVLWSVKRQRYIQLRNPRETTFRELNEAILWMKKDHLPIKDLKSVLEWQRLLPDSCRDEKQPFRLATFITFLTMLDIWETFPEVRKVSILNQVYADFSTKIIRLFNMQFHSKGVVELLPIINLTGSHLTRSFLQQTIANS